MKCFWIAITLCILTSCSNVDHAKKGITELQIISGRDEGEGRLATYRTQTPLTWIRHDALASDALNDTTKPLCEFIIMENSEIIRITIHNFPSNEINERIPAKSQVVRWERQFESLDKINSTVLPQSFSGYSGLMFFGEGKIDKKSVAMLGWSLLLAPEHYRNLLHAATEKTSALYKQMRADVTIKAVGPTKMMEKHKQAIIDFARKFELIREIPSQV